LLQPVRIEGSGRRGGVAPGPGRVERALGAERQRHRQTPRPRNDRRRLPVPASSNRAREGLRRRRARFGPPPAVEEGSTSLHEETQGRSRGPRRPGAGQGGITTPRRGDSALLDNGGRPDPRTRWRRGIAFTTDTRDGGERDEGIRSVEEVLVRDAGAAQPAPVPAPTSSRNSGASVGSLVNGRS